MWHRMGRIKAGRLLEIPIGGWRPRMSGDWAIQEIGVLFKEKGDGLVREGDSVRDSARSREP